jgi:hypothetical protein
VVGACGALAACLEADQRNPTGPLPQGPDREGPSLLVSPGSDTTVDSTGTLGILVEAKDRTAVGMIELVLIGTPFAFNPVATLDTSVTVIFPVPLEPMKHSTFAFFARARDVLDFETVSDSVTVTVR